VAQEFRSSSLWGVSLRDGLVRIRQESASAEATSNGNPHVDPIRFVASRLPIELSVDRFGELQNVEGVIEGLDNAKMEAIKAGANPILTNALTAEYVLLYVVQRWNSMSPGLFGEVAEAGEKIEISSRASLSAGPISRYLSITITGDADCPTRDCVQLTASAEIDAGSLISALSPKLSGAKLDSTSKLAVSTSLVVSRGTGLTSEFRQIKQGNFRVRGVGSLAIRDSVSFVLTPLR
jgi:hypothetical protein